MQTHNSILPALLRRAAILLVLVLVATLWLTPQAFAQGRGFSPEQMKERMAAQTQDLIKQLNLTADQKAPVDSILAQQNDKRLEMFTKARESGSGMQGMREQMMALDEETASTLSEVLTPDQLTKYKEIREAQAAQRGRRGGQ